MESSTQKKRKHPEMMAQNSSHETTTKRLGREPDEGQNIIKAKIEKSGEEINIYAYKVGRKTME